MRITQLLSFVLFASSAVVIAAPVQACRCQPPPPPKVAMEQAMAVFAGKVVSIEPNRSHGLTVTFEVDKAWKGVAEKKMIITTPTNSCGHRFEKGKEYVVYASGKVGSIPDTNLCHRTKLRDQAAEDLKELGAGKAPEAKKE